jgi:regulator of sigma E protease
LVSILIAVLIFGLIVVIHEFGHFAAARSCGVLVEEFAIGMGPVLLKKKVGETLYSLRAVPIGGFCKMLGEDAASEDARSFSGKPARQKALILVAGAAMNFVLAFVIFLVGALAQGFTVPQVRSLVEGSPAEEAGLLPGDRITRMNGVAIRIYEDFMFEMSSANGSPIELEFKRGGEKLQTAVVPYLDPESQSYKVGFMVAAKNGIFAKPIEGIEKAGIAETIGQSFHMIGFFVRATVIGLVRLVGGKLNIGEMSGPIGIVTVIGDTYKATESVSLGDRILTMLQLCGFLSANLGVFNLLPLPALDGGRLVFVLFEAIRRKPVPADKEGIVHLVGFVLLLIFAAFIAVSDIQKIILPK